MTWAIILKTNRFYHQFLLTGSVFFCREKDAKFKIVPNFGIAKNDQGK